MTKLQCAIPFYWLRFRQRYNLLEQSIFTGIDLIILTAFGFLAWGLFK